MTSELRKAVAANVSMAGALRSLGLSPTGGGIRVRVKKRIAELGLDVTHWTGQAHLKGKPNPWMVRVPLETLLCFNSRHNTNSLRKRLLKEGIFGHACTNCGLSQWLKAPIPLELDHIDGDKFNNLLINLRLLCPNCHALTPTYRGRNIPLTRGHRKNNPNDA